MSRSSAFIAVLLLVSACEFEMEKEFFNEEVTPFSNTFITVDIKDMPDTLLVLYTARITYSLDIQGAPWFVVYKVLDDTAEYLGYAPDGSFTVSNSPHRDFSTLEVVALATSATGSMADKSFRELMLFGTKKVLRFDRSPPAAIPVEAKVEDGSIVVSWPKYPHENLHSWRLKKSIYRDGTLFQENYVGLGATNTTYRENAFIGDKIAYQIISVNSFGKEAIGDTTQITVQRPRIVDVAPDVVSASRLRLTWARGDMYDNLSGYEYYPEWLPSWNVIADSETTEAFLDPPFGRSYNVQFKMKSNSAAHNIIESKDVWLGEKTIQATQMLKDPSVDRLFFFGDSFVARSENGVMDSLELDFGQIPAFHLSADGSTLYAGGMGRIFAINTGTMAVEATYSYTYGGELYSLTTVGDYIYLLCLKTSTSSNLVAYNMSTGVSTLNQFHQTLDVRQIVASPDGQYLLSSGFTQLLHRVVGDGTVELVTQLTAPRDARAMFLSSTEFASVWYTNNNGTQYGRYSVPDCQLISETKSLLPLIAVDVINGCILTASPNFYLDVHDFRTGNGRFSVKIRDIPGYPLALVAGDYIYRHGYLLRYRRPE